jgi:hypothetical protein
VLRAAGHSQPRSPELNTGHSYKSAHSHAIDIIGAREQLCIGQQTNRLLFSPVRPAHQGLESSVQAAEVCACYNDPS